MISQLGQLARAALVAVLLLMPATASGQPEADFVVDLPVLIDGVEAGSLSIGITGSEVAFVGAASFERLARGKLVSDLVDDLSDRAIEGRIPIAAFSAVGLTLDYDPATLSVSLAPEEDQREVTDLPLGVRRNGRTVEPDKEPFVAYANIRGSQGFMIEDKAGEDGREPFTLGLDGAARVMGSEGAAIEWSAFYEEEADDPWTRGEVRVVHDDAERAIRYSALDIFYDGTELQGTPPLLGVSAERQFGTLQPFRVVTSTGQESFTLTQPARVEIYVNGIFQEALRLRPGRYELSDVAFVRGLNDVRVVVEDDSGERRTIDFTLSLSPDLLEPGLSVFSANAGLQRGERSGEEIEYDPEEPAVSTFLRHGLNETVTVGANYQGDPSVQVGGLEGVLGTPVGTVAAALSGSLADGHGPGFAGSVDYTYNFALVGQARDQELDLEMIYTNEDFQRLGDTRPTAPFEFEARARLSGTLPLRSSGGVSARYAAAHDGRADDEVGVGFSLNRRFGRVSVGLRSDYVSAEDEGIRSFVTMSLPLGPDNSVLATWESERNRTRVDWVNFSDDVVGDVSGRVGVTASQDDADLEGDVDYRSNRFVARARHDVTQSRLIAGERVRQRSAVGLETSIAYAGGAVAVGRPITDAFAIVRRHPSLDETRVLVNPREEGPQAVADVWGPALLPTVDSYRPQTVRWQAEEPPVGYDLGDNERLIVPSFRSGSAFRAGSAASLTVLGFAVDPSGEPLSLVPGRITATDARSFEPQNTFTNRKGRFAGQGLEPGSYMIEFATDPGTVVRFTIEEDASGLVELGTLGAQKG